MFKKENLRRNFLRVKQNIDQNLGRAEKSEVLSEDQQENEKRVDVVKHAFQNISKKAGVILQTAGVEYDKRLKKLPETNLGHSMLESAQTLGPETLLGSVCQLCGDCQINLAKEHVQYEMTVEQEFVAPLQNVVDVDIPSIIKLRKNLNKSTLDMDSAKSRFNQAVRQSHVPGANMANAAAKADVIREEFEDASQKVENIKDNLSIELCNFAAKESEHSNRLLLLLEAQAEFHRKALEAIEDCIPQMKVAIQNSPAKPCYGMPLEEHLRLMCRDIALVLEACVLTLLEMGALKQYLRELPEPLLTFALYDEFMQAASLPQDQRLQTLWTVINKLPKANYNNFRYLIKFLSKLAERSDVNKMKPSNIAIVIGPNLMWTEKSNAPNMLTTGTVSAILEAIVTHADWFFPGAFDFHLIGHGSSPVKCREPGFLLDSKLVNVSSSKDNKSFAANFAKSSNDGALPTRPEEERHLSKESKSPCTELTSDLVKSFELQAQSPQRSSELDDSSSDESNPFSSKFEAKSVESSFHREQGETPFTNNMHYGERYNDSKLTALSGTNTGDYDNVMYTMNPHHVAYFGSHYSPRGVQSGSSVAKNEGNDMGSFGQPGSSTPSIMPPSRPSRLLKRHPHYSPVRMESQSEIKSWEQSYHSPGTSQTLDRSAIGSTPNISSLNRSTSDAHLYPEPPSHGPHWNRPSQKSNFNSLKRGSDPCLSLPSSNFNSLSNQRPLRLSRSQLGAPPKHVESTRSLSQMPEHVPLTGSNIGPDSHFSSKYMSGESIGDTPRSKMFLPTANLYPQVTTKAGNKTADYSTQVRAMWDSQQSPSRQCPAPSQETIVTLRDLAMSGNTSDSKKVPMNSPGAETYHQNFVQNPGFVAVSPDQKPNRPIGTKGQELDFSNVGYHYEEDQDGTAPQTPVDSSQPHITNTEALHVQVTPGQCMAQFSSPGVSPVASTNSSSSNLPVPSDSPSVTSPVQRRATRKPAPPPPPERPFNVVVTATATGKPGSNNVSPGGIMSVSSTGGSGDATNSHAQQNKVAPLASPESSSESHSTPAFPDRDRYRMSFHGDRPSVPPPDKPDRPRIPPLLNPPPVAIKGHQRSASTGAVMHPATSSLESFAGVPNAGSLSFPPVIEGGDPALTQGAGFDSVSSSATSPTSMQPGTSNTLGRHSSLRPRPSPPPPPPPIAKQTEDTKL
ncbi:rho GTPase-activating protein 17 [Elysia marginata]|uniref:Rho GTPase-activating protein 17 n=1 Tax=Elysia marginata TaxID=1093978 RepID=A0AAV4G5Y2_9GAST|nr:rho GTPase-activating protein 17 [Elysia marginata]